MQVPSIGTGERNHPDELIYSTHFNLQVLCAVDIITTGNNPKIHDIEEVTIFPLNSHYQISRTIIPFNCLMKPRKHWRMMGSEFIKEHKICKKDNERCWWEGIDRAVLRDLFDSWVESKLKPVERKKIMILCYDYGKTKAFLTEWLGFLNFESNFHWQVRDIMSLALFTNDFADTHAQEYKIQKCDFGYICSSLKIAVDMKDSISRAHAIAQVWESLLYSFYSSMIIT